MPTQTINLNDALPAAPANSRNMEWQADPPSLDPTVVRDVSAFMPAATTADLGLVKPDGQGVLVDAAGKITAQMIVGFMLTSCVTGNLITPPGRLIAPRAGTVAKCKAIVHASDLGNLIFRIKQNGVDIFLADPSIPGSTAAGTLFTFTNLTATPLIIAADDIFTIDIVAGTAPWSITAQLE